MLQVDHLLYDGQHVQWQNHLYQVYEILHSAEIREFFFGAFPMKIK